MTGSASSSVLQLNWLTAAHVCAHKSDDKSSERRREAKISTWHAIRSRNYVFDSSPEDNENGLSLVRLIVNGSQSCLYQRKLFFLLLKAGKDSIVPASWLFFSLSSTFYRKWERLAIGSDKFHLESFNFCFHTVFLIAHASRKWKTPHMMQINVNASHAFSRTIWCWWLSNER